MLPWGLPEKDPVLLPHLYFYHNNRFNTEQFPCTEQLSRFMQSQTDTFSRRLRQNIMEEMLVVTTALKIKRCSLILSLITTFPSLPSGSMTRQESPSTLLHYGAHWWPSDRQPNTIYHQRPTTTNTPTPSKPWFWKGRKKHKQHQSTKVLLQAARYSRPPESRPLTPLICSWISYSKINIPFVLCTFITSFIQIRHCGVSRRQSSSSSYTTVDTHT